MKTAIIGAGYVGLTFAAVLSSLGHRVRIIDKNPQKIKMIRRGEVPFYEPKLPQLIKKSARAGILVATQNYKEALADAEVIFICVGTPMTASGAPDLSQVYEAANAIGAHLTKYAVIVNKSTAPVGTAEKIAKIIVEKTTVKFDVASCPEFLREGSAVADTLNPSRVLIGAENKRATQILLKLHKKIPGKRVITNLRTAELIKYASNAFLATKISFINEIANLCEELGANVDEVALGMGLDPRIGPAFLKAGIGYGGSCFPKDTRALHSIALSADYDFKLLKAVIEVNRLQRQRFIEKIKKTLGKIKGKRIGVLGLAFKANTDDVRESAAIEIVKWLLQNGAKVFAYDPKASENARRVLNARRALHQLNIARTPESAADDAAVLLILTEWAQFVHLNWKKIKERMATPIVIDGRNLLSSKKMEKMGFQYIGVGRSAKNAGISSDTYA